MANRWMQQFRYSLEKQVVDLWAHMTFDAVGDATLTTSNSKGIASVTHTGAGTYTVTLQDTYVKLLMATKTNIFAGTTAAPEMQVLSETVNTLGSPVITIQFSDRTGTATDPADTEQVKLQFSLGNSTAY